MRSNDRLSELVDLLEHEDPYVRLWAASYTLQIMPTKAEKVLEEISHVKGVMAGFSAKMTLEEWKKGTLNV